MAWDENLPDGNLSIAQGDDDIRANNTALEVAIDREHEFATGGSTTGRHKFDLETLANFNLQAVPDSAGAIGLETAARTNASLAYYDGVDWKLADVGVPNIARVDEVGNWDAMQNSEWLQVVPAGGLVAIDFELSPSQYVTVSTDVTISNPINAVVDHSSNVMLEVTMSGAGHLISWDTAYVAPSSVAPFYSDAAGAKNVFYLSRLQDQTVLVTSVPDIGTIP